MATTEEKKEEKNDARRGSSYRLSETRILNSEDLHELIVQLPRFLDIAENTGNYLIVEIWIDDSPFRPS